MKCNMNYRESYKYDPMPERDDHRPCPPPPHPHHKFKTAAILRCGNSVGTTPICSGPVCNGTGTDSLGIVPGGIECHSSVLATVALETSELIDPTVKIDFSSLISFRTTSPDDYFLRLVFRLSQTGSGYPIPLGTWTFEESMCPGEIVDQIDGYFQETESFNFSWCSCDSCPDCSRYIIELVDQQCCNIDYAVVTNISLSALAVGLRKGK